MRKGTQEGNHGVRPSAALASQWARWIGLLGLVLVTAVGLPAQDDQATPDAVKFKTLVNFDDLFDAYYALVQGTDGNLYGTAANGGANSGGGVYKMTPAGTLTTIYNFCGQPNCADGWLPRALALGAHGDFYGATIVGGLSADFGLCAPSGCGTIFKITPGGDLTTLYNVCSQANCVDGEDASQVVQVAGGNFYGTMEGGGAISNPMCGWGSFGTGCGTVFKITPQGGLTTLYNFCSQTNCTDGGNPASSLILGDDGDLYGMTNVGGANNYGTIFKVTLDGTLTTLHSFDGTDGFCGGQCPPMVQAPNGDFYGVADAGGTGGGNGVFFRMTPSGIYTVLYNFCSQPNCADGGSPFGLIRAVDGNFYGVTASGGSSLGYGTIFKLTPSGALTTLHAFDGTDGENPQSSMTQATNGTFFGTTVLGGADNHGTIFALSIGLGPFVETLPTSGKVGDSIQILGTNLTDTTGVSFNGTPAAFTVHSKTLIETTVPAAATTGFVTVTGPEATLKSNALFHVLP